MTKELEEPTVRARIGSDVVISLPAQLRLLAAAGVGAASGSLAPRALREGWGLVPPVVISDITILIFKNNQIFFQGKF